MYMAELSAGNRARVFAIATVYLNVSLSAEQVFVGFAALICKNSSID